MSAEETKDLLRQLYGLVSPTADLSLVDQLLTPDYTDNSPGTNQGPEAVKEFIKQVRTTLAPKIFIDELIAEGDMVVVQATLRGKHQGSLMGEQVTGKEVILKYVDVAKISAGRIRQTWHYEAEPTLSQQLGLTGSPE